ncbi:MAG TPA: hypothetical protein VI913_05325 [Candidatus Peribacteraceae bacterium]|nr:hypothetical protein [Candidatus Peribacteraceae bacterium]
MNKKFSPLALGLIGCLCFGLSLRLVYESVNQIVAVRQEGLPVLAELPVMERRQEVLKEQLELSELQAALRVGSPDELVHAYVLPTENPVERFVASLNLAADALQQAGVIGEISSIETSSEQPVKNGLVQIPIRFSVALNEQGTTALRQFMLLAGRLTVADALLPSEIEALFERVEADNPTGIVPLEQFLSANLLDYAHDAKAYEGSLNHAIPQPLFTSLLMQLSEESALRDVRDIFGGLGPELKQQRLWPLPLVTIQELVLRQGRAPGWWQATVTASIYRRTES